MRLMTLKPIAGHYAPAVESKVHQAWRSMITRCHQPSHPSYHNYGGRGIQVCRRWRESFEHFLADVGEPEKALSLDRVDNDGHYEPSNVRWATKKEQGRNRRTCHFVDYFGERITIMEASERCGLSHAVIHQRIGRGWTGERLFKKVERPHKRVTRGNTYLVQGSHMSAQEISKHSGVSAATIIKRVAAGITGDDLARPSARPYRFRPK